MTLFHAIIVIPLLFTGFSICIGCAFIGIDKAVRKNDPSYYLPVGSFIGLALLCAIGLASVV